MAKYTVLKGLKIDKTYDPGDEVNIDDKSEAQRLIGLAVIAAMSEEETDDDSMEDAINELVQVEGITKDIAVALVSKGFDSIAKIQNAKAEDILALRIRNVGKATAEKFIAFAIENFEVEE